MEISAVNPWELELGAVAIAVISCVLGQKEISQ